MTIDGVKTKWMVGWAYCYRCKVDAPVGRDPAPICPICGRVMTLNRKKA